MSCSEALKPEASQHEWVPRWLLTLADTVSYLSAFHSPPLIAIGNPVLFIMTLYTTLDGEPLIGSKPIMTILFPFSQPFHPGQWELTRKSTRHFWKIKISFSDRDISGCHGSSLFFLSWTKGIRNGPAQGHVMCLSDSQENFMFISLYLIDTEPTLTSVYLRILY